MVNETGLLSCLETFLIETQKAVHDKISDDFHIEGSDSYESFVSTDTYSLTKDKYKIELVETNTKTSNGDQDYRWHKETTRRIKVLYENLVILEGSRLLGGENGRSSVFTDLNNGGDEIKSIPPTPWVLTSGAKTNQRCVEELEKVVAYFKLRRN